MTIARALPASAVLACGSIGGCAPGVFEGGIDDPATGPRVAAIARIQSEGDRNAIPRVVECLASNDAVVREAAIGCLKSLTGQTLDYRPSDPPLQRQQATDRWLEWCRREHLVAEGAATP